MYAARCLDELWVAVKCQSSPEIAGSPRNVFWYRLVFEPFRGRALEGCLVRKRRHPIKLRILKADSRDSVPGS